MIGAMSTTSGTNTAASSNSFNGAITKGMGRDAFMYLMIVQMQNQDPMKPMEDKEFLAQLAQFSSLEQMQQVSEKMNVVTSGMQTGNVISLIGHTVTAQGPEDDTPTTGMVTGIDFSEGSAKITIGDTVVEPSWILSVEK